MKIKPTELDNFFFTTTPGSYVTTSLITHGLQPNKPNLNYRAKKFKKNPPELPNGIDEAVQAIAEYFSVPIVEKNIVLVRGKYNSLFAPYFNNKILPLRPNGLYSRTLEEGEIVWKK